MKVYQIMTTPVISVQTNTTIEEIIHLLIIHRISSVPVVAEDNRVVGIISKSDLFLREKNLPFSTFAFPTVFKQLVLDLNQLFEVYEYARYYTAAEVMTAEVVCVYAEDNIENVIRLMARRNLKRIPVLTEDAKLVGIISRTDLLRLLMKSEYGEYVE